MYNMLGQAGPTNIPEQAKHIKYPQPLTYDSTNVYDEFKQWVLVLCQYLGLSGLAGDELDPLRIRILGQFVGGPALQWLLANIYMGHGPELWWTF